MVLDDFSFIDSQSNDSYVSVIKTVFIGAQAVGKTNLFTRIDKDQFQRNSKATIGVDFAFKEVSFRGKKYKV